jgi:hypothetical protein
MVRKDMQFTVEREIWDLDVVSSMKEKLCGRLACSDKSFQPNSRKAPTISRSETWHNMPNQSPVISNY